MSRSLLQQQLEACAAARYPLHMPGHKRRCLPAPGLACAAWDTTEVPGTDDLHDADGILAQAMARAAALWGSRRCWFLVGGSTAGLLAAVRAAAPFGSEILCARNCHKSIYHAIELCDLRPVWLTPLVDEAFGVYGSISPAAVAEALDAHPDAACLVLTSPTYEGKFYTEKEVGYYNQANKWCGMGQLFISGMINGVAQPVLTKVSDDLERQKRVFRKMLRFTAFVSFPAMLGLGIVSEELITITITDKWYSSISIMQILCISGAFTPIAYLYQQLIISKGKSRIYMWNTIALGIILLSGVLLVHSHGIYAMLAVYVSTNILWLLTWHYFVWQEIGLKLRHALIDILPYAVIATTVMVITYYSTRSIENIYLRLASKIVLAAALYVAAMWGSRSVTFKESIQYFIKKKPHEP